LIGELEWFCMRRRLSIIFIAIFLIVKFQAIKSQSQDHKETIETKCTEWSICLSGDDWKIASFEPGKGIHNRAFAEGFPMENAVTAIIPGNVQWDLERTEKIPPIYYGLNRKQVDWVAGKEWWYRKNFTVPSAWKDKTIHLRFDAVDYLAEVWLNGHYLGKHEGQFTPFEFDITKLLQHNKENVLAVLIHAGPASMQKAIAEGKSEWSVLKIMKEAYPYWKSKLTAGWDFGEKIIAMGIWQDVHLIASDEVYLKNPIVLPQLSPPYKEAILNTRLTVLAQRPQIVRLNYYVRCLSTQNQSVTDTTQEVSFVAGSSQVNMEIKVPYPQLWWPNGYGKQPLYELVIIATTANGEKRLHVVQTKFGIRDLKMLPNPQSDDNCQYRDYAAGHTGVFPMPNPKPEQKYLMQINGRRIFARGSNWIPCDLLYGRPQKSVYEYLIRSAADANCNLLRIWGGGIVEKQVFYDLCDQYGIMIYSEFPIAGYGMQNTDEALAISAYETKAILPLWMNHPSIVRYGGGNEQYNNAQTSPQLAQIRAICNEVDTTRPFHDADPEPLGQRHGNYWYDDTAFYQNYRTPRINGAGPDNPMEWNEFGVAGASSVETLGLIMPEEDLWPVNEANPIWNSHKAFNAYGKDNWLGLSGIIRLFGEMPDLKTMVRCSQFVQAEGLRYACQSMRRFRWHRSACATWNFNEPWPNAAFDGLIEYYGRKQMAYYYLKHAYAAIDVLAVYSHLETVVGKPLSVELWATNDSLQPLTGYHCRYRISDLRGKLYADKQIPAEVPAEGSVKIGNVEWTPPEELMGDVVLVWLDLLDPSDNVVAQHLYTFGTRSSSAQQRALLSAMLSLPQTKLKWHRIGCNKKKNGEREYVIEIQNIGQIPALFVKLDIAETKESNPAKVSPIINWCYFDENYFSLLPGQSHRVRITFSTGAPEEPSVSIEAWNTGAMLCTAY